MNTQFQKGQTPWNKGIKMPASFGKKISLIMKGKHNSPKTQFKKGQVPLNKGERLLHTCLICKKEFRTFLSQIKKYERGGSYCSKQCSNKSRIGKPSWFSGLKGKDTPNWRGGVTPITHLIRNSLEYDEWRTKVFERDNYTCQICDQVGGYLHADHIKSFAKHPELRLDVNNGRTLCIECHYEITFKRKMAERNNWSNFKTREVKHGR